MQLRPGIAKTSLLIEGACGLARIERDEATAAPMRLRDSRLQQRHSSAGPAGLVVNDEFFKSRVFAAVTDGGYVR